MLKIAGYINRELSKITPSVNTPAPHTRKNQFLDIQNPLYILAA